MKTLYLDCGMGAAGDMLAAALLELVENREEMIHELNHLGIPGVQFVAEKSVKCGITGTHLSVTVHGEEEESHDHHHEHHHEHEHHDHDHHHHGSMHDIEHIVCGHLPVSEKVKKDVMAVYALIAEAESHVHGVPVTEIHFHEVGTMDAVADITAVCLMLEKLGVEEIVVSPIHVGSGQVRCAHGILPVPAPATAHILRDAPIYSGSIRGELCTPTGAALLQHFKTKYGPMPAMRVSKIGYGMGKKDFEAANCVRAMLGETEDKADSILELNCNVDDMTAEQIGFALERLMENGALDAFTIAIGMKKCRPGTLIRVLCREDDREKMVSCLFKHTTTLGIREASCRRHVLSRRIEDVETPFGAVHKKVSTGYGVEREKFEYEDIARIAREQNMGLSEILRKIQK